MQGFAKTVDHLIINNDEGVNYMPYCTNCGGSVNQTDKFCAACGSENKIKTTQSEEYTAPGSSYYKEQSTSYSTFQENPYLKPLSSYYLNEFENIRQSSETYKGKFNFAAFLWGPAWAFYRGLYLSGIIAIVLGIITSGVSIVLYWFIFGARGNWMLYNMYCKNKQLPF